MSGKSKEEIAFDLVSKLKGVGVWGENNMVEILNMYAECLEAASGLREVNGRKPSALRLAKAAASTPVQAPVKAPIQAAAPAPRQAAPQQAPAHAPQPPAAAQQAQARQQQQMLQQAYQQQQAQQPR